MPGAVPKTLEPVALTNATLPYALEIANKGWQRAMKENPEIRHSANVVKGKITYKAVADAFGLEYTPIKRGTLILFNNLCNPAILNGDTQMEYLCQACN